MIRRSEYLDKLSAFRELQLIKVVTGIRRCGKSTLLEQYKQTLLDGGVDRSQIVSVNFEELENADLLDYKKLYDYLVDKLVDGKFTYIFLDEIQKVAEFEKTVDSLYVKSNVDIYITGSNAYLLSGELATYLSGRYVEINLLPLSFAEYREFMGGQNDETVFNDYITYGGLPYAAMMRKSGMGAERTYLEGIYNTVFIKDIEERQKRREADLSKRKVTDIPLLKNISRYLSSVIGSPVSMKGIADYLTSSGRKVSHVTVGDYVDALEETYLFYGVDRMDVVGKSLFKQNRKYYMVDLGFRNLILPKDKYDLGFSLENVVFLELKRRGYTVNVGKAGNFEIDFVARRGDDVRYFQVTASLLDRSVFEREIAPLKKIDDNYPKTILTLDNFTTGNYSGIDVKNIIGWLTAQTRRCDDVY